MTSSEEEEVVQTLLHDDEDENEQEFTTSSSKPPRFARLFSPCSCAVGWIVWLILETLLVAGFIVFVVANLLPVPYLLCSFGVVLGLAPLICVLSTIAPAKRSPALRHAAASSSSKNKNERKSFLLRWSAWARNYAHAWPRLSPTERRTECYFWALRISRVFCALNTAILVATLAIMFIPVLQTRAWDGEACFSAIGYANQTSVRIFVRCPLANAAVIVLHDDTRSNELQLDPEEDFTATFLINDLRPNTGYRYNVKLNGAQSNTQSNTTVVLSEWSDALMRGSFVTQPLDSDVSANRTRFAFGSCFLKDTFRPLDRIADVQRANPDFVLFLGDFIYIDQGYYLGTSTNAYALKYKGLLTDSLLAPFRTKVPWMFMYDDHEIYNDWDQMETEPFHTAIDAWKRFNGDLNPPSLAPDVHYFKFERGRACFFVLDNRRYRSPNKTPDEDDKKTMLGATQLAALIKWLVEDSSECLFRFVATGVPFTASIANRDTWTFYVKERVVILDAIRTHNITGVIFLSGDRHTAAMVRILDQPEVVEASASPMDGFWSTYNNYVRPSEGETVLGEYHSADYFGVVEVDIGKRQAAMHIEAAGGQRMHSLVVNV